MPEGLLWRAIKGRTVGGLHFRKQHPLGPYVLDFYCHEHLLCVEVDGATHGLGDQAWKDERRDAWLTDKGIKTLRISASCILDDVDDAVRMILTAAGAESSSSEWKPPPSPLATPPPQGEELG